MTPTDTPLSAAAGTSAALRALAYNTREFPDPRDTYPVIGELLAGVRSLQQVLDQLASTHLDHQTRVSDDTDDHGAGRAAAAGAADELHEAGTLLDRVEEYLDQASQHSGRIVWAVPQAAPRTRWIGVAFLDGDAADDVLDLIEAAGPDAAIARLARTDRGAASTQEALENGYVYDALPATTLDRTAAGSGYTLVFSPFLGYVKLLREHDVPPVAVEPVPTSPRPVRPTPAPVPARAATASPVNWFAHRSRAAQAGRSLSL